MKKSLTMILLTTATLLSLASCKEKKAEDNGIIKTDYEAPKPTEPKALNSDFYEQNVEWIDGKTYRVNIGRVAIPSLPKVKDANGQEYVDNTVLVEVTRADSTVFFKQIFEKKTFTEWLNKDYQEKAIMTGISFLETDGNKLKFIASLNYPDAGDDESLDLLLQLDSQGHVSISPFTYNDRDDLDVRGQE